MPNVVYYLVRECYAPFFCMFTALFFLLYNKKYKTIIKKHFITLFAMMIVQSVCCAVECYLRLFPTPSYWRVVLSWVCYITAPAMILMIILIMIRNSRSLYKIIVCIPMAVNVVITSLALFTKLVFWYDENNIYRMGPLANVPKIVLALYFYMVVVASFHVVKRSRWECAIVVTCVVFMLINFVDEITGAWELRLRGTAIAISILSYFLYFTAIQHGDEINEIDGSYKKAEEEHSMQLLEQSIETLAYTIDAKDKYTKGHSLRVAKYARMIAKQAGKDDNACREIYLMGLLHDIGKIAVPEVIINKDGKLTTEEYNEIKKHPEKGARILEKMKSMPVLQDGARYHHERYDGKGYPNGLVGNEIPEYARIIAVADAYDAMTSHRSYRNPMDQGIVKQEIWKGIATQFDPFYAKVMISLIDGDVNYDLREKKEVTDELLFDFADRKYDWDDKAPKNLRDELVVQETNLKCFGEFVYAAELWANPTDPICVTEKRTTVAFESTSTEKATRIWHTPVVIVFTSKDGQVGGEGYKELGVFMSAGHGWKVDIALSDNTEFVKKDNFESWDNWFEKNRHGMKYRFLAVKTLGRISLELDNELMTVKSYLKMPDDFKDEVFIAVTGENCIIKDITVEQS